MDTKSFDPTIDESLKIRDSEYVFQPLKNVSQDFSKSVQVQEGGKGYAYRLKKKGVANESYALKVFKKMGTYEVKDFDSFKNLQGLAVLKEQVVINSTKDCPQLAIYPALKHAVLMPWISGTTWGEIIGSKKIISLDACRRLAIGAASVFAELETHNLAHCDISGGNVIINPENGSIELIDIEDMYIPTAKNPCAGTTPGYGHPEINGSDGWGPYGDRFAGAIFLAEVMGWHDESIRQHKYGETYFDPTTLGQFCGQFDILKESLKTHFSPKIAELFTTAWLSSYLEDCPSFLEWKNELLLLNRAKDLFEIKNKDFKFGDITSTPKVQKLQVKNISDQKIGVSILPKDTNWLSIDPKSTVIGVGITKDVILTASTSERPLEKEYKLGSFEVISEHQIISCDVQATIEPIVQPVPQPINWTYIICVLGFVVLLIFLFLRH